MEHSNIAIVNISFTSLNPPCLYLVASSLRLIFLCNTYSKKLFIPIRNWDFISYQKGKGTGKSSCHATEQAK